MSESMNAKILFLSLALSHYGIIKCTWYELKLPKTRCKHPDILLIQLFNKWMNIKSAGVGQDAKEEAQLGWVDLQSSHCRTTVLCVMKNYSPGEVVHLYQSSEFLVVVFFPLIQTLFVTARSPVQWQHHFKRHNQYISSAVSYQRNYSFRHC